jgi:hypothetical protein
MLLTHVLQLHSVSAGLSGAVAVLIPSFFGAVFPSLDAPEALGFIVRVYAVLLVAQAPLLHGIRQLTSAPALRLFCAIYTFIFLGTAIVCAHSHLVLDIVRDENRCFILVWLGLSALYAAFAYSPSLKLFSLWSLVHMVSVVGIGAAAVLDPERCNIRYFLVPNTEAYNTISRYYGVLILGMSFLAAAATQEIARPMWRSMKIGFCCMFAVSGGCLAVFLTERGSPDMVGGGSLLMFMGLASAYGTAHLPPPTTQQPSNPVTKLQ